jgi:hypothetical protein
MPARTGWRLLCVTTLAALIGAGFGACGGGGGSSTTAATSARLTKSQLIAQGDAICKEARDRFAQLQGSPPTTAEETATFTQKLVDITESEVSQLRALNAPSQVKPTLDRYLRALDKNIDVLKQGLKAARRGDATAYAQAQAKAVQGQVKRLAYAQAVGFEECSRPAGTAPSGSG